MARTPKDSPPDGAHWGQVYKRLVLWSIKRFRLSLAESEDLVQEAITQLVKARNDADDLGMEDLLRAVGSRVNGIRRNHVRKKAANAVRLTADGVSPETPPPVDAEDRVATLDWSRKAISLLLDRVDGDDVLLNMVTRMAEGEDSPNELATALGVDRKDIYNARRRLNGHAAAVKTTMEES